MLSSGVMQYLRTELAQDDPWRLESNPYEKERYDAMLDLLDGHGPFDSGLEVGCAAGAFSAHLVPVCRRLRLVDVLPEALDRARRRLGDPDGVSYSVAQIADCPGWGETYDLIVVSEILYFLEEREQVTRAVAGMRSWLRPGGLVVFGSALDAVTRRWGLRHGAETAMEEWEKSLHELGRVVCRGATPDENALVVKYVRPE